MTDLGRRGGQQRIPRPPGARKGKPAPWSGLRLAEQDLSLGHVREVLANSGPPKRAAIEAFSPRASAVLMALYVEQDQLHAIFTRRAQHLRAHRGEVSFPGGGQEPEDEDLKATALREANEEVNLDPSLVEVIGELDHLRTVTSRSYIVPFVSELPYRPDLEASPAEVEMILYVPISELLDPDIFREERWGLPGLNRPVYFFELLGDTIWGATAAMLVNFLSLLTGTADRAEPGI